MEDAKIIILAGTETTPSGDTLRPGEYLYDEDTHTIYTEAISEEE